MGESHFINVTIFLPFVSGVTILFNASTTLESMAWREINNTITKEFTFNNFVQALAFINKIGLLAEEHNHHPDILLHGYKHVRITMTTHSVGNKVTNKDRELAELIDKENI